MPGFSTTAWKLVPRDRLIGWMAEMHEKNLALVIDDPGFLILPWITIPNLGSHSRDVRLSEKPEPPQNATPGGAQDESVLLLQGQEFCD